MGNCLISRIALRNYRSIAVCDVVLGPLTFLVGRNGAGKSNFLDALRFVADSLRHSVDHALRERGGVHEVRRRSSGHPTNFGIRIEFDLPQAHGHLAFEIAARTNGRYDLKHEQCVLTTPEARPFFYSLRNGVVSSNMHRPPAPAPGQLYLVRASGDDAFRPVMDALAKMGFYNLNPDEMRKNQPPAPEPLLHRDGRNIASVLFRLEEHSPENKQKIEEYLASVVNGIVGVTPKHFGAEEGLEFRQNTGRTQHPWRFHSVGMSDGTLRALGVITALFQSKWDPEARQVIGIEEPECALHPWAVAVLVESLRDASETVQVLVTSHSPELLDDKDLTADQLLAVVSTNGRSSVGPIDETGRTVLRDRLCSAGELMRMEQIAPDPKIFEMDTGRLRLFDRNP